MKKYKFWDFIHVSHMSSILDPNSIQSKMFPDTLINKAIKMILVMFHFHIILESVPYWFLLRGGIVQSVPSVATIL
jgi:hypothetical protein